MSKQDCDLSELVYLPDGDAPKVSFLCPTFGRAARQPRVINEMVYWFTRQTHPNCELIILNDAPGQTLECAVPNVRVINWPWRMPTLGGKMNILIEYADEGSICLPSEDDDVSLPWRAGQAVEMLKGGYDYWNPQLWVYAPDAGRKLVVDGKGVGHNCSAFRRDAFVGKYPRASKGHDALIDSWARMHLRFNPQTLTDTREVSYVYRWGVSDFHLSAQHDMELAYESAEPGPSGVFEVRAEVGLDYETMFRELTGRRA